MGFLNQSFAQIRDLFASMTPAARITAVLLLAVIGVSVGYLFQDYTGGSKEFLLNGDSVTSAEANRMEAAIAKAGLSDFERQGNRISVPRGQKALYLAAIANEGALPANADTLILDESANLGMFVDRKTRDDRMKAARERLLSMMVREMDGVEVANVMFDIREPKGFEPRLITATVSVRPASGEALTARRIKMIRAAVAGATAGLNPKDVAILNLADGSQFEDGSVIDPDDYDDPYFQTRSTYERQVKANIEDLLRHIPGVRVQVTAELEDVLSEETRTVSSQGDPQPIREETNETTKTDTQVEDRGPPGLTSQGPQRVAAEESVQKNERNDTTNTRDAQNFVPTTEDLITRAPLTPQHVRAVITIPSDFIVSVWQARFPEDAAKGPPSTDEMKLITGEYEDKIKAWVSPLLPSEATEDKFSMVEVGVFQSLTPEPIVPPSMASQALGWLGGNSGTLIMAGLALVSLVMLRGMVKSIPTPETNVVLSMPGAEGGAAGGAGGDAEHAGAGGGGAADQAGGRRAGDKGRPKLRLKKGTNMKEDLTDMVREDPDAAAAILRTWISNAG